jgi:hypothetical protein
MLLLPMYCCCLTECCCQFYVEVNVNDGDGDDGVDGVVVFVYGCP